MRRFSQVFGTLGVAVFAAILAEAVVPSRALASDVTWTTNTTSISVTAGDSASVVFSLTDNSGISIIPEKLDTIFGPGITGNPLDSVTNVATPTTDPTTCFALAYLIDGGRHADSRV
jgi:hypothetical protein